MRKDAFKYVIVVEDSFQGWFISIFMKQIFVKHRVLFLVKQNADIQNFSGNFKNSETIYPEKNIYYGENSLNYKLEFGFHVARYLFTEKAVSFKKAFFFKGSFAGKIVLDTHLQERKISSDSIAFLDIGLSLNSGPDNLFEYEAYENQQKRLNVNGARESFVSLEQASSQTTTTDESSAQLLEKRNPVPKKLEIVVLDEMGLNLARNLLDEPAKFGTLDLSKFHAVTLCIPPHLYLTPEDTVELRKNAKINTPEKRQTDDTIFLIAGGWREQGFKFANYLKLFSQEVIVVDVLKKGRHQESQDGYEICRYNPDDIVAIINRRADLVEIKHVDLVQSCHIPVFQLDEAGKKTGLRERPTLSVALMHYERPVMIRDALKSVYEQSQVPDEINIFDDGSCSEEALDSLSDLEAMHKEVRVFRQENQYLGALRNFAAANSKTDLIYFLDDDNILRKDALETFYNVYLNTQSPVIGSYSTPFTELEELDFNRPRKIMFSGVGMLSTINRNWICDGNCLIERAFFNRIGGNSELSRVGSDDHEFFLKALAHGGDIEIIPKTLYGARQAEVRLRNKHFSLTNNVKIMRLSNAFHGLENQNFDIDPVTFRAITQAHGVILPVRLNSFKQRSKLLKCIVALTAILLYQMLPRALTDKLPARITNRFRSYLN